MRVFKRFLRNFPGGFWGLLVLVAIVVAVVVGSFVSTRGQQITKSDAAAQTTLSLSPSSQTLTPGQNFTLTVKMNTGTNHVIGFDVNLNFDANALQVTSLTKGAGIGSLDQEIKRTFDNTTGTISYSVFTLNTANAVQGSSLDTLVISGTVKSTASSGSKSITFNSNSLVSDSVDPANVLQSTTGATITVGSTSTNTPTPLAATVTPTRVNSPTPLPTSSNSQAATTLSLTTPKADIGINQNLPVSVMINTGTNAVIGVDLDITYNKNQVTLLDITPGSFFTSPDVANKVIDNTAGRAKITIATPPNTSARQGTGTLALLTFRAVGEGSSRIDFGIDNHVAALNMTGLNALKSVTGLGITVTRLVLLGDIDEDLDVDIVDYVILFGNFGKNASDPSADPRADINNDGKINILDYTYVFENFGRSI